MPKPKYTRWLEPNELERITNWAANGCTDEQLAANMGIVRSTLYEWQKKPQCSDISNAIKNGRELRLPNMENTFFKRAKGGMVITETIEEFRGEVVEGKPYNGTIVKRTVKKELPPDQGSLMFYLKNKAGYRSEPRDDADESKVLESARALLSEIPSAIG